jgi:hypothetical protein
VLLQLIERIRRDRLPALLPPPVRLPQGLLPFIGRRNELDRLCDLLVDPHHRLITVCGPA